MQTSGADGGNTGFSGNTGGFGGQGQFGNVGTMQNTTGGGNTPFDTNALASLWMRMFQQMGGGMNPMMGGGVMNPMMAAGMGAGNVGMDMGMGNTNYGNLPVLLSSDVSVYGYG